MKFRIFTEVSKIIKDPVWGYIEVNPVELKLINHHYFLRLQDIKQSATAL